MSQGPKSHDIQFFFTTVHSTRLAEFRYVPSCLTLTHSPHDCSPHPVVQPTLITRLAEFKSVPSCPTLARSPHDCFHHKFPILFSSRVLQKSGLCPPASRSLTVLTTAHPIQLSTSLSSRVLQKSGLCPPASLSLTILTTALIIQLSCFARVLVIRHLRRRRRRCRGPANTSHSLGRRLCCSFVGLCCCRTWCHARCPCYYCWCEVQDLCDNTKLST